MKRNDPRHGTHAGAVQHKREGKRPCKACLKASAEYMREYRQRTTNWRDQAAAKQRALSQLAKAHPDEYRTLYEQELSA